MGSAPRSRSADGCLRPCADCPFGRSVIALLVALLAAMLAAAAPALAVEPVDEVHYTLTGPTSVAFDWRGETTEIRYGTTAEYTRSATAGN